MMAGISRAGDTKGGRELRDPSTGAHDLYATTAAALRAYVASYPARFPNVDLADL